MKTKAFGSLKPWISRQVSEASGIPLPGAIILTLVCLIDAAYFGAKIMEQIMAGLSEKSFFFQGLLVFSSSVLVLTLSIAGLTVAGMVSRRKRT